MGALGSVGQNTFGVLLQPLRPYLVDKSATKTFGGVSRNLTGEVVDG